MRRHYLFWLLLLLTPSISHAATDWKWIAGDVNGSGWAIAQGSANVEIKGGRLDAKLCGVDGITLVQALKGYIASGQVKVVRRMSHGDVGDETMSGTYTRKRHGDSVYEAIIVQTQWGFLGITRTAQVR